MGEKALTLDALPHDVQLEIAFYLDLDSLASLSEVNRAYRSLSRSFKSYWIPSILQAEVALPIASHRALPSLTASELHLAVHKALFRERNLLSSKPRLYSHSLIEWPFAPPRIVIKESNTPRSTAFAWESPEDAISKHLAHPNGNWLFLVSKDGMVRILNLRTKTLACEKQYSRYTTCAMFAMDFMGDVNATMVLVTDEKNEDYDDGEGEEGPSYIPVNLRSRVVLRVLQVTFDSQTSTASLIEVAKYPHAAMPISLDIAGEYILYATRRSHPRPSNILLIKWANGQLVDIPALLPSGISRIFRGYFLAMGNVNLTETYLQVVSIPWPDEESDQLTTNNAASNAESNHDGANQCSLVASIRLPPYGTPNILGMTPLCVDIFHIYTGKTKNNITVWCGYASRGWNIFTVEVDFSKPPERWFEDYHEAAVHGEEQANHYGAQPKVDYRKLFDRPSILKNDAPPGRRFIWPTYDRDSRIEPEEEGILSDSSANPRLTKRIRKDKFKLWALLIDHLPMIRNLDKLSPEFRFWRPKSIPLNELEVPEGCALSRERESIYSIELEERCGIMTCIMSSGNIWVMRYGHS